MDRAARDLVRRLDLDEVATLMLRAYEDEIAPYAALDDQRRRDVWTLSRRGLGIFVRWLEEGIEPTEADLAEMRDSARARVAQGVPLEDVLRAHRLGGRIGYREFARVGRPSEARLVSRIAELVMELVDRFTTEVTHSYIAELDALGSEGEREARELLDGLTEGRRGDAQIVQLAGQQGLPLVSSYTVIGGCIVGAAARRQTQLAREWRRRGLLAVTEGDVVTGIAPDSVAWQTLDMDRDLLVVQQDDVQLVGLAASREIVRQALHLLRASGRRGQADLSEQLPELLLGSSPTVAGMLIERVFGPLVAHPDLAKTLRTLLDADLDRARAAAALHIHRNTLLYRLARIEELTGLDLRRARDLAIAYLAAQPRDDIAATAPALSESAGAVVPAQLR